MNFVSAGFAVASWIGIVGLTCCGANQETPEVHLGSGAPHIEPEEPRSIEDQWLAQQRASRPEPMECRVHPSSGQVDCGLGPPPSNTPPVRVQGPPPQPISTSVPHRACRFDRECGDGFCDRGQCASMWSGIPQYGQKCRKQEPGGLCGGFICLDGRCRSCGSHDECDEAMGRSDGVCGSRSIGLPGRNCGILGFRETNKPPEPGPPSARSPP
jgi:hypothetical protein